ncbi:NFATC2-interacting protein [Acipenser oxyrinchus oxyrinchus]|uniref:NFATC2-interacting protein n=1 Tax=Acipenser oxyrinchus oxyrinchus TaxID=40147 RepID=A0AAD8CL02_ACIOX|nr:NFATC2-interacting protein [Acipenser oxyrinchus oxyrinchus]
MAEKCSESSDSDVEITEVRAPVPKRRRIIDPSTVCTVHVYSDQVSRSLLLNPAAIRHDSDVEGEGHFSWAQSQKDFPATPLKNKSQTTALEISDSEEEPSKEPPWTRSPSPPPTPHSLQRQKGRAFKNQVDRKLNEVGATLSPVSQNSRLRKTAVGGDDDDDDVILLTTPPSETLQSGSPRELVLKIRCRADLYRIPVKTTDPLSSAVEQLSIILKVPSSRILLLQKEAELPVVATATELGLGIADIIDCVVISEGDRQGDSAQGQGDENTITLRLQGKDKESVQLISAKRVRTVAVFLLQYHRRRFGSPAQRSFLFDGEKVLEGASPTSLDMEDGDVIEVWL